MARGPLTQDYDAHVLFTFAHVPEAPALANRAARVRRWFTIAFAESWLAVLLFRAKMRLRHARVPFLPGACDLLSRSLFAVQIGDRVEVGPGLMITHGHVVIDGRTRIGRHCQVNPWVTIGLSNSRRIGFSVDGPTIGDHVHIGTGAKILGPVTIGDYARIGANAVVVHDVPANVTVVGAPARVIGALPEPRIAAGGATGRDARIAEYVRMATLEYRLHRESLGTLLRQINESLSLASDKLRGRVSGAANGSITAIERAVAGGDDQTPEVIAAIDAIDAALAPYTTN